MYQEEFIDEQPEVLISISEEDGIRYLHFGTHWIQGAMRMSKPNDLVLSYTQKMMAWLLFKAPTRDCKLGILGLGAGSLLRYCLRYTESQIETVEIDEQVTFMCQGFFRLPHDPRSIITHQDAEEWVANRDNHQTLGVLMVDLYDAEAQGPVCSSASFYQNCFNSLKADGVASINLFGSHHSYDQNLRNIQQAFNGQVLVFPELDEGNTVVFGFKSAENLTMTTQQLLDRAKKVEALYKLPAMRWAKTLLSSRPVQSTFTITRA